MEVRLDSRFALGVDANSPRRIDHQQAFAVVQYDQAVAPWICHDGAATDRDVEWRNDDVPSGPNHRVGRFIGGGNREIGFELRSFGLDYKFRTGVRHSQARRGIGAPDQRVT